MRFRSSQVADNHAHLRKGFVNYYDQRWEKHGSSHISSGYDPALLRGSSCSPLAICRRTYTKGTSGGSSETGKRGRLERPGSGAEVIIATSTIRYWVKEERKERLSSVGSSKKTLTETEMELVQIKRELAQVKMERDF